MRKQCLTIVRRRNNGSCRFAIKPIYSVVRHCPRALSQVCSWKLPVSGPSDSLLKTSVILPRGIHPFPSRTRKLSPAGPIVLHAKVCGRVGRCRHRQRPRCESSAAFSVFEGNFHSDVEMVRHVFDGAIIGHFIRYAVPDRFAMKVAEALALSRRQLPAPPGLALRRRWPYLHS